MTKSRSAATAPQTIAIRKVGELRKHIGRTITFFRHDIRHSCRVLDIKGRNVYNGNDWLWFPDLRDVHVVLEADS